jgi:NAD(P)H-binding
MHPNNSQGSKPAVAVFGAAGHTGRFVVAELLRRGITPIAIARDPSALAKISSGQEVELRQASIGDPQSLDHALEGAQAVINCAGPFLDTADAVVSAALRSGIHYLDVSAEQANVAATLDTHDAAARKTGVVILPAMGFYGGFADLLVTAARDGWDSTDSIEILIGLDSWHPTRGTRTTGARNKAQRMVIADGRFAPLQSPAAEKDWEFGDPLGHHRLTEVPFAEIIQIARHINTKHLHTYLSQAALRDIRNPATPAPTAADAAGRSPQRFTVHVVATREAETRQIAAQGRDIYAFSAPLVRSRRSPAGRQVQCCRRASAGSNLRRARVFVCPAARPAGTGTRNSLTAAHLNLLTNREPIFSTVLLTNQKSPRLYVRDSLSLFLRSLDAG